MAAVMQNVLQREIMVAETVKSYSPYPALLPLSQQGLNYSCTTSCSSSLLPAGLGQAYSTSPRGNIPPSMIRGGVPPISMTSSSINGNTTPSGLGAGGMGPGGMGPGGMGPGGMGPGSAENCSSNSQQLKDSIFAQRKQREFIPDNKKDDSYWDRRRRNNEAAKRSREKRRFNDMVLEQRVLELSKDNHILRAQVTAFENKFHFRGEDLINEEQVLATLPQAEQLLSLTKRPNLSVLSMPSPNSLVSPSPIPPSPPSESNNGPDDDQYSSPMPQYSSPHQPHLPTSIPSQQTPIRSHSPDYYEREPPQTRARYSPSPESQGFYVSTALNLSARSNRSPSHNMEYCDEQINRTVDYSGSSLPHKLRHKTNQHNGSSNHSSAVLSSHLNSISNHHYMRPRSTSPMLDTSSIPHSSAPQHYQDNPSPPPSHMRSLHHHHQHGGGHRSISPSRSPTSSHHGYSPIKREPMARDVGEESPVSSDDSGVSLTSSPTLPRDSNYPTSSRDSSEEMEVNVGAEHMRSELLRLAEEVRSLKDKMNRSIDQQQHNGGHCMRR